MIAPIASVVIPVHNEQSLVAASLARLCANPEIQFEITVVANGCTDGTEAILRNLGQDLTIIVLASAGKSAALNRGNLSSQYWPRIFLDVDVVVEPETLLRLAEAMPTDRPFVASPRLSAVSTGSQILRRYHRVWETLPVMGDGYVGGGLYALNELAARRVLPFPDLIADDEYVRTSFAPSERGTTPGIFTVPVPSRLWSHVSRARRIRRGNSQLVRLDVKDVSGSGTGSTARHLLQLSKNPANLIDLAAFCFVSLLVRGGSYLGELTHRRPKWSGDAVSRGL